MDDNEWPEERWTLVEEQDEERHEGDLDLAIKQLDNPEEE